MKVLMFKTVMAFCSLVTWLAIPAAGQVTPNPIVNIAVAPTGTCNSNTIYQTIGTGVLTNCQNGTWTQLAGGGSWTGYPLAGVPLSTGSAWGTSFVPASGAIPFGTGSALNQDAGNLFWDNVNKRLGVGTATPGYKLEVKGSVAGGTGLFSAVTNTDSSGVGGFSVVNDAGNQGGVYTQGSNYGVTKLRNNVVFGANNSVLFTSDSNLASGGSNTVSIVTGGYNNGPTMTITGGNPGNVGIATTTPGALFHAAGNALIGAGTGALTQTGTFGILDATATTGATTVWFGHDGSGTFSVPHISATTTKLTVVAGATNAASDVVFNVKSAAGEDLTTITANGTLLASTLQAAAHTTDPGCTTTADIGKLWFDNTTTTTVRKTCNNVAGTLTWVTF